MLCCENDNILTRQWPRPPPSSPLPGRTRLVSTFNGFHLISSKVLCRLCATPRPAEHGQQQQQQQIYLQFLLIWRKRQAAQKAQGGGGQEQEQEQGMRATFEPFVLATLCPGTRLPTPPPFPQPPNVATSPAVLLVSLLTFGSVSFLPLPLPLLHLPLSTLSPSPCRLLLLRRR